MTDATSSNASESARWVAAVVGLVAVAILALSGRAMSECARYRALGDAAALEGRRVDAVFHWRHAAQWYVPGSACVAEALTALDHAGDQAAAQGDVSGALMAWRSERAAVMSIRHVGTPFASRLPSLHTRIADAMATQNAPRSTAGHSADAARYAAQLNAWPERLVSPPRAIGAGVFFVGWFACLYMVSRRGLSRAGGVVLKPLLRWSALSAVCMVGWMLCVRFA